MFINSINRVLNKNVSLFSFPSDFKLAWKAKQKNREPTTKNQLFLYFFVVVFFLIQDIRKSKTPIFEKGLHKNFLGQVLTIFQTTPCEGLIKFEISKEFDIMLSTNLTNHISNRQI